MPRTFSFIDGITVADLLRFGFGHLSSAEFLLNGPDPNHFDSAGYLAHLGFEHLLKAWHLQVFNKVPGIHNLDKLWNTLLEGSHARHLSLGDSKTLKLLDEYAELRYPNINNPVEIGGDDSRRIGKLLKSLLKRMPGTLHKVMEELHWSTKGGRVLMERPISKRRRVTR